MFRRIVIGLSLVACCALPVQAAELPADKKAAIKELLDTMNLKAMVPQMVMMVQMQMGQMLPAVMMQRIDADKKLSAEEKAKRKAKLQADLPKMGAELREEMGKIDLGGIIEDSIYTIYGKHFEAKEIRDVTAFYRSPTGQKMLKLTPQITAESMQLTSEKIMPKLLERADAVAERLNAKK
ncbi:DUF2059 domain-containing protein [Chitinimonas lacunae]|uniref:DUF2059 domain-containing protein n=1 Tax=Chitinimonas lacunae TaxID=1963018 RepID=A0ABV8MQB9_9NEIS